MAGAAAAAAAAGAGAVIKIYVAYATLCYYVFKMNDWMIAYR